MQIRAEGRQLYAGDTPILVALCQEPDDADVIARAVNDVDKIEGDLSELATAAGLDYARGWSSHELLAEVTRQVRMVRRTMMTREFDHHSTR